MTSHPHIHKSLDKIKIDLKLRSRTYIYILCNLKYFSLLLFNFYHLFYYLILIYIELLFN